MVVEQYLFQSAQEISFQYRTKFHNYRWTIDRVLFSHHTQNSMARCRQGLLSNVCISWMYHCGISKLFFQ